MYEDVRLVVGEFVLRHYSTEDIPDIVEHINDAKVSRFTIHVPFPYTEEDAVDFLTKNEKWLEDGIMLNTGAGSHPFDRVLSTTSPGLLARLAPDLPQSYLDGLLKLKHMGAVVMTLSLKHQLSENGYYWFNIPKKAGFPFLAVVEHTNYVSPENFGGERILYCGDYLELDHEYFDLSDDELLERFIPGIQRINPAFGRDWINNIWVHRSKYAQPVPLLNHSKNIPAIQTPLPGLYFASMSQVYPWDRGTNFAVEIGRKAAQLMMRS